MDKLFLSFLNTSMKSLWMRLKGLSATAVCSVYVFSFGHKGCASVRRQQSKKGGRRERRGWKEVKARNPHPSLLLQAPIGKYLDFLNFYIPLTGPYLKTKKNNFNQLHFNSLISLMLLPFNFQLGRDTLQKWKKTKKLLRQRQGIMCMQKKSTWHPIQITTQIMNDSPVRALNLITEGTNQQNDLKPLRHPLHSL